MTQDHTGVKYLQKQLGLLYHTSFLLFLTEDSKHQIFQMTSTQRLHKVDFLGKSDSPRGHGTRLCRNQIFHLTENSEISKSAVSIMETNPRDLEIANKTQISANLWCWVS